MGEFESGSLADAKEVSTTLKSRNEKRMKTINAVSATVWLYSAILFAYVVARIVINRASPWDLFIDGIPVTFWHLGLVAYVVSAGAMMAFLLSRR